MIEIYPHPTLPLGGGRFWERRQWSLRVRKRKILLGVREKTYFRRGRWEKEGGVKKRLEPKTVVKC